MLCGVDSSVVIAAMLASMHSSLLLWLLLATGVFWCVGVYNRLMRMRAHGLDAFGSVEKLLANLEQVVVRHLEAAGLAETAQSDGPTETPPAWLALQRQLVSAQAACKAVRTEPLCPQPMAALKLEIEQVRNKWLYLRDGPADLAGSPVSPEFQAQWDESTLRLQMARSAFNQIVERYNESLLEFPANMVAGIMGFRPAGVL